MLGISLLLGGLVFCKDVRVSFPVFFASEDGADVRAKLDSAGFQYSGEKKFPDSTSRVTAWKWLEVAEAERLLPASVVASIGNSKKSIDRFQCRVGHACVLDRSETETDEEEISSVHAVPSSAARTCDRTAEVKNFLEISDFTLAAPGKPGNFLVCVCGASSCRKLGDLEISGPIARNFLCIAGDAACVIGNFAGKGLSPADRVMLLAEAETCGVHEGEIFSLAKKSASIPVSYGIGNFKICYCMEDCVVPASFQFAVGNLSLKFPITGPTDFECVDFPCSIGPWEKISDFTFTNSDSLSLVAGDCGEAAPAATAALRISGSEISALFSDRIKGGEYSACFCGGAFFARPEICANPATNARIFFGKISVSGPTGVSAAVAAVGAELNLEISGLGLEKFPDAIVSSPQSEELRNFQVPLRGGNFQFFWQSEAGAPSIAIGNLTVAGPLRRNFQVACKTGVRCRLPKVARALPAPEDALALSESEICPEFADEAFPINGYLEADYFAAGGTRTLCFCGLIGNFCEKIGDVVIQGPRGFAVVGAAVAGANFALEILGEGNSDAVRTVDAKISDCSAAKGAQGSQALARDAANRKYEAYFEYAGNFQVCHCDNSTGGCGVPKFPVAGKLTVRGPDGLEIFDTEFPENIPFAGRPTKIEISGVGLAQGDRIVFSSTACTAGNFDETISDLNGETTPETVQEDLLVFSNFRFTFGGLFYACFKPQELNTREFPITIGAAKFAANGPFPLTISDFFAGKTSVVAIEGVGLDSLIQVRVSESCTTGMHSTHLLSPGNFVATVSQDGDTVKLTWSVTLVAGGNFQVCFCGDDTFRGAAGFCKSFISLGSFKVRGPSEVSTLYVCHKAFDCSIGPVQGTELASFTYTASVVDSSAFCSAVAADRYTLDSSSNFDVGAQDWFGSRTFCVCAGGSCGSSSHVAFSAGSLFVTGLANGAGANLEVTANIAFSLEVLAPYLDANTRVALVPYSENFCDLISSSSDLIVGSLDKSGSTGSSGDSTTSRIWPNIKVMLGGEYLACFTSHETLAKSPVTKLEVAGARSARVASLTNSTLSSVQTQATFTVEIVGTSLSDDDKISMSESACGTSGARTSSSLLLGTSFVLTTSGVAGSTGDTGTSRFFSFNKFIEADIASATVNICWCAGESGCSQDSHFGVNLGVLHVTQ